MTSEELGLEIEKIIGDIDMAEQDCILITKKKLLSLLSKTCWLKDAVTGEGIKKFEVVKPIEVRE